MGKDDSDPQKHISNSTIAALAGTAVTVTVPLVFPQIPLDAGLAIWTVSGGLLVYAGRDWIRNRLPARWRNRPMRDSDLPIEIVPAATGVAQSERPTQEPQRIALQNAAAELYG